MPLKFEKKKPKGIGASLDDKEMAERIRKEKERYEAATDSEFWSCLCFKDEEEKEAFCKKTGVTNSQFITGKELREKTKQFKPEKRKRTFLPRFNIPIVSNPLDYGEDKKETEEDGCIRLAAEVKKALLNPVLCKSPVVVSNVWICVVFKSRQDSEDYLDEMNLRKHGNKYIDASSWLKELEGGDEAWQ